MMFVRYGLVFFLAVIFPTSFVHAADGVLYLVPGRAVHAVGDTFKVEIFANTDNTPISAAEAELRYDPSVLSVEEISTDGSVLGSWSTVPAFPDKDGKITFSGWSNDHYSGVEGLLVTIAFRALRNTSTDVRLTAGAILSVDGGSNIITSMRSAAISIQPREVIPKPLSVDVATTTDDSLIANSTEKVSVLQPVFTEYESTIKAGDRIIVKGSAPADAKVSIWIEKQGDAVQRMDITSGPDGTFTFVSDEGVESGEYRLWAQAIDADGVRTATSTIITIAASPTGLAASAGLVSTGSAYLPILIIGVLGFGIGYLFHRRTAN